MEKTSMLRWILATTFVASAVSACSETQPIQNVVPTPTNNSIELDPDYEMCVLPTVDPNSMTSSDVVNAYIAGTPMPPDVVIAGDRSKLEKTNFSLEEIVTTEGNNLSKYQVVLIPVGYDRNDLNIRMPQITSDLSKIFHGVNIDFSYLNKSVPIQINNIGRLLRFEKSEDADLIYQKLNEVYVADSIIFVVNDDSYGGSGSRTAIATGENKASLYTISHELAHGIYQKDGYQRFYRPGLSNSIPNNEIFYDPNELGENDEIVGNSYRNLYGQPPTVNVGKCNGTPVSSFYGVKNIMNSYWSNDELIALIENDGSPFTSFQIQTMNEYIKSIVGAY